MGCGASTQNDHIGQPTIINKSSFFGALEADQIKSRDPPLDGIVTKYPSDPAREQNQSLTNLIQANEIVRGDSAACMRAISGGAWGPGNTSPGPGGLTRDIPSASVSSQATTVTSCNKSSRKIALSRGTALNEEDRAHFGLTGLLPPIVQTIKEQSALVIKQMRGCHTQLDRYTLLSDLQHENETLFFHVISSNIKECMPIIYTPTVGEACLKFGHIMKHPKGMYLSIKDKGNVAKVLANWPQPAVKVVVMTDGERILGLGDLGAFGMGIPIGKLNLYSVAGGIDPAGCLPLMIDVGTENEQLLKDDFYTGLRHKRVRGPNYDEFIDEIMTSLVSRWPDVLIQFEDFGNRNAFRLLEKYQDNFTTFNDDIQGTASVALAGYLSALRVKGTPLINEIILFQGAGEAGCGIADLLVAEMVAQGASVDKARSKIFLVDSQGLVTTSRGILPEHKKKYVKAAPILANDATLLDIIKEIQPTSIVGVSAQPNTFTPEVLAEMAKINHQPIVFALSNPTHKAECTAEDAIHNTQGRALFCSGSPFDSFVYSGRLFEPGQGNNTYIFPGIGLGVLAAGARPISDSMFRVASRTLSQMVSDADLEKGCLFPPLADIRSVSHCIAVACAEHAWDTKAASKPRPLDIETHIADLMYSPQYQALVRD